MQSCPHPSLWVYEQTKSKITHHLSSTVLLFFFLYKWINQLINRWISERRKLWIRGFLDFKEACRACVWTRSHFSGGPYAILRTASPAPSVIRTSCSASPKGLRKTAVIGLQQLQHEFLQVCDSGLHSSVFRSQKVLIRFLVWPETTSSILYIWTSTNLWASVQIIHSWGWLWI